MKNFSMTFMMNVLMNISMNLKMHMLKSCDKFYDETLLNFMKN